MRGRAGARVRWCKRARVSGHAGDSDRGCWPRAVAVGGGRAAAGSGGRVAAGGKGGGRGSAGCRNTPERKACSEN